MGTESHSNNTPTITTAEAKAQQLKGWDLYETSSIIYLDAYHRQWAAVSLCHNALDAFKSTILLSLRDDLAVHRENLKSWIDNGALHAGLEMPTHPSNTLFEQFEKWETLRIACGFELILKARLIAAGVILHELDSNNSEYRALAKRQRDQPVFINELLAIKGYMFNGTINFLPGLTKRSISFSTMMNKKQYFALYGLSTDILDRIEYFRELRNMVHLPFEYPRIRYIVPHEETTIDWLVPFVNNYVIAWANTLVDQNRFSFPRLDPI